MKYKNIGLLDYDTPFLKKYSGNYSFVKYDSKYFSQEELERIKKIDFELGNAIEKCPKIYSELSDHSYYMIVEGERSCIGAIYIGTSCDEKNIEVKLVLDEEKLPREDQKFQVINQIVHSLRIFYYDKDRIDIDLKNKLDLRNLNSFKYRKTCYLEGHNTYEVSIPSTIFKLIKEMEEFEKHFIEKGYTIFKQYQLDNKISSFDKELLDQYSKNQISIAESFLKAKLVQWDIRNPEKPEKLITLTFDRNGKIITKMFNSLSGQFNYCDIQSHVHSQNMQIRLCSSLGTKRTSIITRSKDEHQIFLQKKEGTAVEEEITMSIDEKGEKHIIYTSSCINNTSLIIDIVFNQNFFKKCYIDFRKHKKSNGKVNETYYVHLNDQYQSIHFKYRNRKGLTKFIHKPLLGEDYQDFISNQDISNISSKILEIFITLLENSDYLMLKTAIEKGTFSILFFIEQVSELLEEVKSNIPKSYLQIILEEFMKEYQKDFYKQKQEEKVKKLSHSTK